METNFRGTDSLKQETAHGAAIYNRLVLSIYDLYVLGFSNAYAWQCSARQMLDFYNQHVSDNHLDVGVGTGYFLDNCKFKTASPRIALADLNSNSLEATAKRLSRYRPEAYVADILEPLRFECAGFDSVGLSYVLHCLPGKMAGKGAAFKHLKPFLNPGAVVFGMTILGRNVPHNALGKMLMSVYNKKGIFSNREDDREGLESILKENFGSYQIETQGCVAFFTGRDTL